MVLLCVNRKPKLLLLLAAATSVAAAASATAATEAVGSSSKQQQATSAVVAVGSSMTHLGRGGLETRKCARSMRHTAQTYAELRTVSAGTGLERHSIVILYNSASSWAQNRPQKTEMRANLTEMREMRGIRRDLRERREGMREDLRAMSVNHVDLLMFL